MDLSTLSISVGRFLFAEGWLPDGPGLARPVNVVVCVGADEGVVVAKVQVRVWLV